MNRSKYKYNVGEEFLNNDNKKYIILEILPNNYRKIKFLDSGYVRSAYTVNIKEGKVKDYTIPTICGVGIVGNNNRKHYLYNRWQNMINRCYNRDYHDYKNYGAKGIIVCDEWHVFDNYVRDIEHLLKINNLSSISNLQIDKDLENKKMYSRDSVSIISKLENVSEMNKRTKSKSVLQYSKDNNLLNKYNSVQEAYEQTGVWKKNIGSCCNGRALSAGNYIWKWDN